MTISNESGNQVPLTSDASCETLVQPKGNNTPLHRCKQIAGGIVISLAALMAGMHMNNKGDRAPLNGRRDYQDYQDKGYIHREIENGNDEIISILGPLDYPGYLGREKQIYDALVNILYRASNEHTNGGKFNPEIEAQIRALLTREDAKVQWLWMEYVRKAKKYCKDHLVQNPEGGVRETFFENVPSDEQIQLILVAAKNAGIQKDIDELVESENNKKRQSIDEIAQGVANPSVSLNP